MFRLVCILFSIICLSACSSKKYDIKGVWINSAQFVVTNRDTIWDSRNIIWELEDSVFSVYEVGYNKVEMIAAPANWQIKDKKLHFNSPIAEETWDLIHLGKDSLVVCMKQGKMPLYWTFHRMLPPQNQPLEINALHDFIQNQLFDFEGPTLPKILDDYPMQLQFKEDKFFVHNIPQVRNSFLLWGVTNFKDRPILVLNSILSKQLNHIDLVEVTALTEDKLQGRYFKNGKPYTLVMTMR